MSSEEKKDSVFTFKRPDKLDYELVKKSIDRAREVFGENMNQWHEEVKSLYLTDEDSAIGMFISKIHNLVCELKTDKIDFFIKSIIGEELNIDLGIALLLVTYPARNYLEYRTDYYQYVYNEIENMYGEDRAKEELATLI